MIGLPYGMVKKLWRYVKPFSCDTGTYRTDGRTDIFAISISRVSMLTRDKNRLFKTAPDINEPSFQFIHTMFLSVVDIMLHDSPDLVIHRTEIWTVWRPQAGRKIVGHFLTQQFNCCTCVARCASALSCWNTKSLPRHSAYCWQQYDVIMTSWSSFEEVSKRYHQISCFVRTMKLPHALQIYSTVFVKKCTRCIFQGSAATNYR